MPRLEYLIGAALVLVSLAYRLITGTTSFTVWIPAIIGVVLALAGLWAASGGGTAALWAVRLVAAAGAGACLVRLLKSGFDVSSYAGQSQAITAVLCTYMLVRSLLR